MEKHLQHYVSFAARLRRRNKFAATMLETLVLMAFAAIIFILYSGFLYLLHTVFRLPILWIDMFWPPSKFNLLSEKERSELFALKWIKVRAYWCKWEEAPCTDALTANLQTVAGSLNSPNQILAMAAEEVMNEMLSWWTSSRRKVAILKTLSTDHACLRSAAHLIAKQIHQSDEVGQTAVEALAIDPSIFAKALSQKQLHFLAYSSLQTPEARKLAIESLPSVECFQLLKQRDDFLRRTVLLHLNQIVADNSEAFCNLRAKHFIPAYLASDLQEICFTLTDDFASALRTAWQQSKDGTILHILANHGSVQPLKVFIGKWRQDVRAVDGCGNTPLHMAARGGHLECCQILMMNGALLKRKNSKWQTPRYLAKASGHSKVCEYLESSENLGTVRGGLGDALDQALRDERIVTHIQWYFIPLPGLAGTAGGQHSLLAVTVEEEGNWHSYVIEKAAVRRGEQAQRCGVHISHWIDVMPNVESNPFKDLAASHFATDAKCVKIRELYEIAIATGNYDIVCSNCHHAALHMYNRCAACNYKMASIPNSQLIWAASMCKTLTGIDLARSESTVSQSQPLGSQSSSTVVSQSALNSFSLPNVVRHDNQWASPAADLALWIYTADIGSLSPGFNVDPQDIHLAKGAQLVQWAVITSDDTIFIVFKGTDDIVRDGLIDANVISYDHSNHGLSIHGGMWLALNQRKHCVPQAAMDRVQHLLTEQSALKHVVLSGHSLGGGYALLTALDFLHAEVDITAVVTFGAPQVVVPVHENATWRKLNAVASLYINEYDLVPRLPSCQEWLLNVIPSCAVKTWWVFKVQVDVSYFMDSTSSLRESLSQFDCVGTLLFIASGSRQVGRVPCVADLSHREHLCHTPPEPGMFILENHSMRQYQSIIGRFSNVVDQDAVEEVE